MLTYQIHEETTPPAVIAIQLGMPVRLWFSNRAGRDYRPRRKNVMNEIDVKRWEL